MNSTYLNHTNQFHQTSTKQANFFFNMRNMLVIDLLEWFERMSGMCACMFKDSN